MKKLVSLILCSIIILSSLGISAVAADGKTGELSILSYNVSGIPLIGDSQGSQREYAGDARMEKIGEIVSAESGCDIIGVQEDFNNHDALAQAMTTYPYQTFTSGGIPLGDGLNIFSKLPIYNIERTHWDNCYGVISGSTDRLTDKGILSSVVEIDENIYVDLYVIHADAGFDRKSVVARADNFRQLADLIIANDSGRAVIIIGDYNFRYERNLGEDFYGDLVQRAGLTDLWAELYNNGDCTYDNGEDWNPTLNESFDRVMYKNGNGIELDAQSLEYLQFTNQDGETYTDHIATKVCISYRVTDISAVQATSPAELTEPQPFNEAQRQTEVFLAIIKKLILVFTHLNELFYLAGQGIDLIA